MGDRMGDLWAFFLSAALGIALLLFGAMITPAEAHPARILLSGCIIGAIWAFGTEKIFRAR
jgi:hypothetical protein